jgi:hypothetical protein
MRETELRMEYIFSSESRQFHANVLCARNDVWITALSGIHRPPEIQLGTNHKALGIKEKQ